MAEMNQTAFDQFIVLCQHGKARRQRGSLAGQNHSTAEHGQAKQQYQAFFHGWFILSW